MANYRVELCPRHPNALEETLNDVTKDLQWACIQILEGDDSYVIVFERATRP